MADQIQIRRDTAANWTNVNPILAQGELGVETNTSKFKVGDGTATWTALPYLIDAGDYLTASSTNTLTNKTIDIAVNTLTGVQPTLVSGTSIKTVNSTTVLGSGDIVTGDVSLAGTQTLTNKTIDIAVNTLTGVQPTLVSGTSIKTVNSTTLLGSGDLAVGDVTLAGTQTLTNKTIDITTNTLTGVAGVTATQTLTNKTVTDLVFDGSYTEEIFTLGTTGSIALNPANGTIQTSALTGNTTFTDSLSAGQSIVLMLTNGASYTVTFPTMTWVGSGGNVAPTLTAADTIVFFKISSVLYGAYAGSFA